MKVRIIMLAGIAFTLAQTAEATPSAQKVKDTEPGLGIQQKEKPAKAWEIGVGGSLINWNRITLSGFQGTQENYLFNLKDKHLMGGVNLYVARELNQWFYLDLQGTVGLAKNPFRTEQSPKRLHKLYMGGLGLQFRFTPLFHSKYVEPYLRVGVNYLHKDFHSVYSGHFENDPTGEASWKSTDSWNPNGRSKDKNSFFPVSLGAGVNAWLSNSFGLGLQGEYLMPVRKGLPRFAQVSARLMWRIGGKSKRPQPVVRYVEVEKPVERIVEKKVEVPSAHDSELCDLLGNVHFDFDKDAINGASQEALDRLAEVIKACPDAHFLLIGCTDAKGTESYNEKLAERRARAVYDALTRRGVPADRLKWKAIGKRASFISPDGANSARNGDRKVLVEKVTNMEYWNALN